jgi:hypothetical protein
VLRAEVVELAVDGDSLVIRPRGAAAALWHAPGPAAAGVSLAGPPRQILFSPLGLSMGLANGTYRLSRGAAVRSVIISRLGRVRSVVP